jgi:hypothetical protein
MRERRRCQKSILFSHVIMMSPILLLLLFSVYLQDCMAFQGLQGRDGTNIAAKNTSSSFGTSIRQEQRQELRGSPLPPSIMYNDLNYQIPIDVDVTSPQIERQNSDIPAEDHGGKIASPSVEEPTETKETRQSGNPKVNQAVPVDAQMTLSIEPEADAELLVEDMEGFLEHYLEKQFQRMIDAQQDEFELTTPIVNLRQVDLTVLLVDDPSRRRRLALRSEWRKNSASTAIRQLQESSRLATLSVNGEVAYSVEVDGGPPTPEDIEQEWNAALADFMSQPRLDEAIAEAGVEGVIRVDQASSFALQAPSQGDQTGASTTSDTTNNISSNSSAEEAGIPWQDNSSTVGNSSELSRPSTLSIIFGFLLTGIAALGLVGYCYIFYRKRKKRLRKKRQMKESISFPARNASIAAAPPRGNAGSQPLSQVSTSILPVAPSPMILTPADDAFSEDTSYKGLESSIGSEDASDVFAKELQKAASLDQQAWEEFQKRKEALDKSQGTQGLDVEKVGSVGKKATKTAQKTREMPPPLLGKQNLSSDEEGILDYTEGVEADLQGKPSFARSYPYGDERGDEDDDDEWVENPMTPRSQRYHVQEEQWEPYNSALPPSPDPMEEKKDEISPSGFFAKELQNIEMDLARYGGMSGMDSRGAEEALSEDDGLSNVDMMSEVEELSKYVRRYEKRKDRKFKREMDLHERFSVGGASSVGTSSMSIGMDGRVYNPYYSSPNPDPSTPASASTMSSLDPPSGRSRGNDISSYAGSYLQQQGGSNEGALSFVSDDDSDGDKEEVSSIRSQRLGISPFSVSRPEEGYYSSPPKAGISATSRNLSFSPQASGVSSSRDDYRLSVGYGYDAGSSNNGRNADTSLSSKSSTRSANRLSNLRANNAIIDSSNSDINVTYDPYTNRSIIATGTSNNSASTATSKRSGLGRLSFRRDTSSSPPDPLPTNQQPIHSRPKSKKTNNNRFDRLRGMFEQKTTEQPAPIYPPGEHWQFEGHKRNPR